MLSEVKHLVVHSAFRGIGLGKVLLTQALQAVETPLAFATIREDNTPSIKLFSGAGFKAVARCPVGDHQVLLLLKRNVSVNSPEVSSSSPLHA